MADRASKRANPCCVVGRPGSTAPASRPARLGSLIHDRDFDLKTASAIHRTTTSRAENFDVWKTRVYAALDGNHLLGYVRKPNYDCISEEESEEGESDVSVSDDAPKPKPPESIEVDSDAVDYDEESEDEKPRSDSDEDSGDNSDTSTKRMKLPVIRPFNRSRARKERKRGSKEKLQPLNPRERRWQEAKTKALLMKTIDNTHVRRVKKPNDILRDLPVHLPELENALKAVQEATDTVMAESQKSIYLFYSMPKSWKNDLRIWKGQRKYIP
ncbi:hypothetical protein ON010_g10036 [Phytophthora cinnamomi]|nr:hypothetical protein ON010_g10036 [Phytophthora cinnamomi]